MRKGAVVVGRVGEGGLKPTAIAALVFTLPELDPHLPIPSPLFQGGSECAVGLLLYKRNKGIANILAVIVNLDTFLPLFLNENFGFVVYSIFL